VTREVVLSGARQSAADAFSAFYRLESLRRTAEHLLGNVGALVLPTAPTTYTVAQVTAKPIELNSRLGTYTNFVNLLDLCGLALPASLDGKRTPFGITLLAPSGHDAKLASLGRIFHADTDLPLGALDLAQPPLTALDNGLRNGEVAIAVVGAHLSGMALNSELKALDGRLLQTTTTAHDYRLYALRGTAPPKPGLLRVEAGLGAAIEVEVWALTTKAFGEFVANVPPPMSIGTVRLADRSTVKGFLVEPQATVGARDISQYGGWRAFLAEAKEKVG
jgi:allophanate hydrolase